MMWARGNVVPDLPFKDVYGTSHHLWEWRQKSHVGLIALPDAPLETLIQWRHTVEAAEALWSWLGVAMVIMPFPHEEIENGVHWIDRYGHAVRSWEIAEWSVEMFEKELIYYEARHC
jgi:hypothetical protein